MCGNEGGRDGQDLSSRSMKGVRAYENQHQLTLWSGSRHGPALEEFKI